MLAERCDTGAGIAAPAQRRRRVYQPDGNARGKSAPADAIDTSWPPSFQTNTSPLSILLRAASRASCGFC